MKTELTKSYTAPRLEMVEVQAETGFAASVDGISKQNGSYDPNNGNDDGIGGGFTGF